MHDWVPCEPAQTGAGTYLGTPTRRRSGQGKLVPGAGNKVSPYFERDESVSGIGLTQLQGFKEVLAQKPAILTKTGLKYWVARSKSAENTPKYRVALPCP